MPPRALKPVELYENQDGVMKELSMNTHISDYERSRLVRIQQNEQKLQQLGLLDAVGELLQVCRASITTDMPLDGAPAAKRQRTHKQRREVPAHVAVRVTRRTAPNPTDSSNAGDTAQGTGTECDHNPAAEALLTQQEYFKLIGKDVGNACVSDGVFKGWVADSVRQKFNIADNAAEAWAAGGGGKFSRKLSKKDVPTHLKARGWSDAKCAAATQLQKNPNAYFYRMVAPGWQQATGDWTEEEHALFMQTVRQHGAGDKWGLFASHIGSRVGYQCSAYYRDVVLAQGLVLDARYRMTRTGRVVFVG